MSEMPKMEKSNRLFLVICLCLSLLGLSVQSVRAGEYVIGSGDKIQIFVWGEPDLSGVVLVRPDGFVSVPGAGEIKAEGLTPMALQEQVAKKLTGLVKNPLVTVSLAEVVNSKVFIVGGGVASGVFDIHQGTTLLQLLAATDLSRADLKGAYVMRDETRLTSDFSKLFHNGDLGQNIILRNNDVVFFPSLPEPYVYVLGAVNSPKALAYKDGMTIIDALLECGGFSKFADKNNTVIVRKKNGVEERIKVRAKDIAEGKDLSQNVMLQRGDYIIANTGFF